MSDEEGPTFLELLESHHDFPGPFTFKVIGRPDDGFIARVLLAFRNALNMSIDPPYVLRQSAKGNFVALTLEPFVMKAEEVVIVYEHVRQVKGLMTIC